MNTSNEGTPAPFDRSYASDAPESSEAAVAVECESVLIIEDDESVREVYEEALALRGFRVAAAPDAKTALEHARRENWSVMMVDLVLPDRNGIGLIEELKALDPDACVIVMTNYASLESAVDAVRVGAYDYLRKPLDISDLQRAVARGAEARRLARQNRELLQQLAKANAALEQQAARLAAKVTTAQREMSALVQLGVNLGAETSMSAALARILDVAASLTRSRGSALLLHDPNRGQLVGFLAHGAAPMHIDAVALTADEGFLGGAATGEVPRVNNEVLVDAADGDEFLRGLGVRRILATPLHAQGALQGLMLLFDKSEGPFTDHDSDVAAVLAQFAASLIAAFHAHGTTDERRDASGAFVPIRDLLRRHGVPHGGDEPPPHRG